MKPEPAEAISAARGAGQAAARLADTAIPAGMSLASHAAIIKALQDAARHLARALQAEGRLARATLAAIPQARRGDAPDRARISLNNAVGPADHAAELLDTALTRTRRQVQAARSADRRPHGQLLRAARTAAHAAADLAEALGHAERQPAGIPVTALAAGHWYITAVLSGTCEKLSRACGNLSGPVFDSGHGRDDPDTAAAAASLGDAAIALHRAALHVDDAHATLNRDSIWRAAPARRPA